MIMLADLLPAHKTVVGWGNNVHLLAHFYDVTPRHVHLRSVHGRGCVRVHTGGIDAYWTLLKVEYQIPLTAQFGGMPNTVLWTYVRSQQWRWECHGKDILAETGQTLARL